MTLVKYNPFSNSALKFRGSVIPYVLPKVVFFLIWAVAAWAINDYAFLGDYKTLSIPNNLIALLGLVLSLLLVFRTNTSYDRYWEGRRLWSDMNMIIRSMARTIWVQVEEKSPQDKDDKKQIIHLLLAFAYSCKHSLRGEYGAHYDDLRCLNGYVSQPPSRQSSLTPSNTSVCNLIKDAFTSKENDHIPILISHRISAYIDSCIYRNTISPAVQTTLLNNLNVLIASYAGVERILDTPIPRAYAIHLSQIVWLFCLFLPFQLFGSVKAFTFVSIISVVLTVFTMFGIINIGEEIENPFGYDYNDLPLDEYCEMLDNEVEAIIRNPAPKVEDWMLSKEHLSFIARHFTPQHSRTHTALTVH